MYWIESSKALKLIPLNTILFMYIKCSVRSFDLYSFICFKDMCRDIKNCAASDSKLSLSSI